MTPADLDLDALEKKARVAKEYGKTGEWHIVPCGTLPVWFAVEPAVAQGLDHEDADHIAAFSPDVSLALLALARRTVEAEVDAERYRRDAEGVQSKMLADLRERIAERDRADARAESAERERDALREALIHLGTLQLRRHLDAIEAWAIRQTANDLSAPFSDERVKARLAEYLTGEPKSPPAPSDHAALAAAPSSCPHPAEQCAAGPRVPLVYESAATQVCACGMWRLMFHRPGPWRAAESLAEALEETDDE